jgi:hypothetical protein
MIRFYLSLLLFVSVLSCGAATTPNVHVVPRDAFYRGEYTEFSVLLNDSIQGLKEFNVRFDVQDVPLFITLPQTAGYFPSIPSFQPSVFKLGLNGLVSIDFTRNSFGSRDDYDTPGFMRTEAPADFIASDLQCHTKVSATTGISGSTELYRNGLLVQLNTGLGSGTLTAPLLDFQDATDTKKQPVTLISETAPTAFDFRLFGDVNADQRLDLADVILILRVALDLVKLDSASLWYADLSPTSPDGKVMESGRFLGDGKLDLRDVQTALRVVTGNPPPWWPDPL